MVHDMFVCGNVWRPGVVLLAGVSLVAFLIPCMADTMNWKANAKGDWFDASNWTEGSVPSAGDDVAITGAGAEVILNRSTPPLGSVILNQTLVFCGWETTLNATEVTVQDGGVITLPGPFKSDEARHRISIACKRLTIDAGGSIYADAKGYAGGVGHGRNDDPTSAGHGPGAGGYPEVWGASPGGSHGGRGGTPDAVEVYGSAEGPVEPGSGGGAGNGVGGGAGGGAVRIKATRVTVNGSITANGGDGLGVTYGGGGSGGSIYITCNTFSGTHGIIAANGGMGSRYAGGGGGGRIAVIYDAEAQCSLPQPGVTFSALGGVNGAGTWGTEKPENFGHPGTLYFPDARVPGVVILGSGRVIAQETAETPAHNPTVSYWMPWKVNKPIVHVSKKLYRSHPRPKAAAVVSRRYVGPGLEMMEVHGVEARDDVHTERKMRFSTDNGRTWSEFAPLPPTLVHHSGREVHEGAGPMCYDTEAGVLVGVWLRQIQVGNIWGDGTCNNFTYYRVSRDNGRTWAEPRQLRYEEGDDFDAENPLKPGFLRPNQAYPGNNILLHSNGSLVHCVAHANAPGDPDNDRRTWKMGSLCFVGRRDNRIKDYTWTAGKRVSISPEVSSRGLMEPEVAELKDGRVLVVWRGSDTPTTPGHKWFSVSSDGGMTLSAVREWKYDDGSSFYSPSSIHRMIRHSVTGKLYWIGNITHMPPRGNYPRFPLVIAEVDEEIPALKKSTVTLVDTRDPSTQGFNVQFSNFSLLENRETHELELFLTTYGQESGMENWMTADCYRYVLTFLP